MKTRVAKNNLLCCLCGGAITRGTEYASVENRSAHPSCAESRDERLRQLEAGGKAGAQGNDRGHVKRGTKYLT